MAWWSDFKPRKQQDGSSKSGMKVHVSSETLASGFFPPSFYQIGISIIPELYRWSKDQNSHPLFFKSEHLLLPGVSLPCQFIVGGGGVS